MAEHRRGREMACASKKARNLGYARNGGIALSLKASSAPEAKGRLMAVMAAIKAARGGCHRRVVVNLVGGDHKLVNRSDKENRAGRRASACAHHLAGIARAAGVSKPKRREYVSIISGIIIGCYIYRKVATATNVCSSVSRHQSAC